MDDRVTATGLSKSFGTLPVLDEWNVRVGKGERVVLLGPSGCGKTTFLRIVAGLEKPCAGRVHNDTARIGFVFQDPRLIPWCTVRRNLEFACGPGNVNGILAHLKLAGCEDLMPAQLSGGMKQRVNLARALVTKPDLLILDEAFSSLDLAVKVSVTEDISHLWEERRFSMLAVTHDLKEALFLADRILLLSPRPTRVVDEIVVNLPDHRSITDPKFLKLEMELWRRVTQLQ